METRAKKYSGAPVHKDEESAIGKRQPETRLSGITDMTLLNGKGRDVGEYQLPLTVRFVHVCYLTLTAKIQEAVHSCFVKFSASSDLRSPLQQS
jgi:hypothetical protein